MKRVLLSAFRRPTKERSSFVRAACRDDEEQGEQVRSLLQADAEADGFLSASVVEQERRPATISDSGRSLVGERLGAYELVCELGRGGMGTVYRARRVDGRFEKEVAIKVVQRTPMTPEVLARFRNERQLLATIEHPSVARLLDGGTCPDGRPYFVMEFVSGRPVDDYCQAHGLDARERLELFCGVCDAVAYLNGRGIIHRDVKPGNVLVTDTGAAKVLDLGIAKLLSPRRPDRTVDPTEFEHRLMTPAYASPEQVSGDAITPASDVYSLGVLLYVLLTGELPYDVADLAGSALERAICELRPVPPSSLSGSLLSADNHRTRRAVDRVVSKALSKRVEHRYDSAAALRADIDRVLAGSRVQAPARDPIAVEQWLTRVRQLTPLVVILVVAGVYSYRGANRQTSNPLIRAGTMQRVTSAPGLEMDPAISPDGDRIAYAAGREGATHIHIQDLSGGEPTPLTAGIGGYHRWPRWSPDGAALVFQSAGRGRGSEVIVLDATGNQPPRTIARYESLPAFSLSPTWSPKGDRVAVAADQEIHIWPLGGDEPLRIHAAGPDPHSLRWSPDGSRLVYVSDNTGFVFDLIGNVAASALWIIDLGSLSQHRVTDNQYLNASAAWTADGRGLLFVSNRGGSRDIYEQRLTEGGVSSGEPIRRTMGLNAHTLDFAATPSLVAVSRFTAKANLWSLPLPTTGSASLREAERVTLRNEATEGFDVSSDGRWILYDSDLHGNQDIFVLDTLSGQRRQLTGSLSDDLIPSLSGDGLEVAFYSFRNGGRELFVMPFAGGTARQITFGFGGVRYPSWSPDGRNITFSRQLADTVEVYVISRADDAGTWAVPRRLTSERGRRPRWSPDGAEIAYVTDGGLLKVMPAAGGPGRIVIDGRRLADVPEPLFVAWPPPGDNLFFRGNDSSIWVVPASGGEARRLVEPSGRPHGSRYEFVTNGTKLYFVMPERESDIWTIGQVTDQQ